MRIGSHVSNSGEKMLLGAVEEALSYKANALMIYIGAPQNTFRKSLDSFFIKEAHALLEKNKMSSKDIVVHAPYIVNLASPDFEKRSFGINFISEEIKRTQAIGSHLFVLHPGAHLKASLEEGLELISDSLGKILENTKDTNVEILIETMPGKGTECCYEFKQIAYLINKLKSPRIKVCLDTCHIFDSGYDIVNNYEDVIDEFSKVIGLEKLAVIHLNDSKNLLGTKKDRHENIGFGNIGFETLIKFCYDKRFAEIPKILETPYIDFEGQKYPPYKHEIEMILNKKFDPNLKEKIVK